MPPAFVPSLFSPLPTCLSTARSRRPPRCSSPRRIFVCAASPPTPTPSSDSLDPAVPASPPDPFFAPWVSSVGIDAPSVALTDSAPSSTKEKFLRGLVATAPIAADSPLLSVPRTAVLQVTSLDRAAPPAGVSCSASKWRIIPWYARLALRLLAVRSDDQHVLHVWANSLPQSLDVPHRWSDRELDALQSPRLTALVREQARVYRQLYNDIVNDLPPEARRPPLGDFLWALDMVRSRSFAGPLEAAPFRERARLAAFIVANTLLWPAIHALPFQNALNGGLTALFALAMYDILLPRILRVTQGVALRRYALTPGIDFLNHSAAISPRGQVSFRYFGDNFEVRADRSFNPGEQVYISYGAQSNDSLLQYYGFVVDGKDGVEMDSFVFDDEVSTELGVPVGKLVAKVYGFEKNVIAAVSKRVGGKNELARKALRAVCLAQLERFQTSAEEDESIVIEAERDGKTRLAVAARYRLVKKRVLEAAVSKLG